MCKLANVASFELSLSEDGGKSYQSLAVLDAAKFATQWTWKVACNPGVTLRLKLVALSALTMVASAESELFTVLPAIEPVDHPDHPQIENVGHTPTTEGAAISSAGPKTEPKDALPATPSPVEPALPLPGPAPSITLLTPNGGEVLLIGAPVMVKWSSMRQADKYSLMFRAAPDKSWKPLVENLDGSQTEWSWMVKERAAKECYVRVIAIYAGHELYDECDNSFAIQRSALDKKGAVERPN
jgi:hypothetical protein